MRTGRWHVHHWVNLEVEPTSGEPAAPHAAADIKQAFGPGTFTDRRMALTLSPPHVDYQVLDVPSAVLDRPADELRTALQIELDRQMPWPIAESQIAAWSVNPKATGKVPAMIVAARNAIAFVTEDGPAEILSRGHLEWGTALERLGRYQRAHEQLEQALDLAFTAGDGNLAGSSLRGLGIVARAMGRHQDSYLYYEDALAQFIELNDVSAQTSTLIWLGVLSTDMGDVARARAYYEEALELTRRTGFRYQESFALSNLGSNANYLGDYGRATSFIKQALEVAREIENRIVECLCLNNLGTVNLNRGDFESSFLNYEQSMAIAMDTGHRRMEASASTGIGHSLVRLGDNPAGINALENGIRIRRELGEVHLYESLSILAHAYQKVGDVEQALSLIHI